ncbi:hypothetical protein D0T25_24235 [Duganella sp. BJB488]|uniref:hypothetical protein n=1 Tax=unclassified Duganella TaxID=2636909 RepID=UPI000E34169C|nr:MULTISPECIES: hypothetical protein [unclassified Duganella]RFP09345.1 hypothetical protein D0T23_26950 [Duganella sp. BJB475]RFP13233.1 hypothetical protein D0T26_23385 [Duganella sp. BJB489]RFP17192.1 hypothetical protein D0T25_24235 [Duganella sp. BJB488]RFP25381.1 hypothetical protein D0T21_27980 [Duganella sp. BJB476]RFP31588.1 hypothetical protein D0T24_24480 [Duganella sp. BJB480]
MIAAIPPLPPLPPGAATAGVESGAAAPPAAPPASSLVDRFAALMEQQPATSAVRAPAHGPSALNHLVSSQDQAIASTLENAKSFSIGDTSNLPQLAERIIHVQTEMAMLTFKLNVANGLAQSGKSSVQTLMKNQ